METNHSNTLHEILHDLSNAPALQDVAEELFENELKVVEKIGEIQKCKKIRMKSKYIFNMVDTSLGLGLYPADEDEYRGLILSLSVYLRI